MADVIKIPDSDTVSTVKTIKLVWKSGQVALVNPNCLDPKSNFILSVDKIIGTTGPTCIHLTSEQVDCLRTLLRTADEDIKQEREDCR